jgi:hypothetical protein
MQNKTVQNTTNAELCTRFSVDSLPPSFYKTSLFDSFCWTTSVGQLLLDSFCWTASVGQLLLDSFCWTASVGRLLLDGFCWTASVGQLLLDSFCWTAFFLPMHMESLVREYFFCKFARVNKIQYLSYTNTRITHASSRNAPPQGISLRQSFGLSVFSFTHFNLGEPSWRFA